VGIDSTGKGHRGSCLSRDFGAVEAMHGQVVAHRFRANPAPEKGTG